MSDPSGTPGSPLDRGAEAHEHIADPPVGGGGRELIAADRAYTSTPHALGRFRWAMVALFMIAAGALAAAVVLTATRNRSAASSASGAATPWSGWRPLDDGLTGAQEIADYIAPYYRATPSSQLAMVTVVNLDNPAAPVQVFVPTSATGSVLPLPAGNTIVYNLCGEGSSNCSIGVGTPSPNRLLLLRREALELALYTFKYISGVQTVVALLPPGYTSQPCAGVVCAKSQQKPVTKPLDIAVAFPRDELTTWLSRPLSATFPESLPPSVSEMPKAREAELVSILTSKNMFSASTASAQDGSTVITLSGPLQPQ